jgi:hypothetical protein
MVARVRLIGSRAVRAVVAMAALAAACKSKPPPSDSAPPPPPPDHLATNEVVEGKEKAFALPLPFHAQVTGRFKDAITVRSALKPEELANFVRSRVKEGNVIAGGASTTFENVIVPAEPARRLSIEVRRTRLTGDARSEMTVRDVTPLPVEPGLSEEERWRKAGFTPQGKPIDPAQTQ